MSMKDKNTNNKKEETNALMKNGKKGSKKGKKVHKAVKITFLMLIFFAIIGVGAVARNVFSSKW